MPFSTRPIRASTRRSSPRPSRRAARISTWRRRSRSPTGAAVQRAGRDARRPPVRSARAVVGGRPARARRHRRRAGARQRLRAPCRRRAVRRARRGRDPGRRQPRGRGPRLRSDVLDLDDDRGVPQPAAHLGARARLLHDRAVLRAGAVRFPGGDRPGRVRERRARGGRARSAGARLPPGHVQVRARGASSSTCSARCTSSGSIRCSPFGPAGWRSRRATSWPRVCPTRPRSATGCAARPAPARSSPARGRTERRAPSTSTTSPTTSGRCASTATRPSSSRPR